MMSRISHRNAHRSHRAQGNGQNASQLKFQDDGRPKPPKMNHGKHAHHHRRAAQQDSFEAAPRTP